MRKVEFTTRFKRDYKRAKKADSSVEKALSEVIQMLAADVPLPGRLRDHGLAGNWKGFRDCHVRPDLLIIYAKRDDENVLSLARLGSHSELFG